MDLKWSQIDLERRTIDFNKPDTEKTNKRCARVPIGRKLLGHLKRMKVTTADETPYVFHQKRDKTRCIFSVVKGFRVASKRAGFNVATPHTLRHTCASWIAQRGEKMNDASVNLNMPILSKVYAHHNDEHIKELADRF